ncbi:sensor histidine kinase [Dactylosporangium sp. NPDC051541]|uniref:sensor histidine kinase n=1 Tax=Dactylosporangium sp. NPDC051541 TaxID=3363977 RepID=UPI003790B6EF
MTTEADREPALPRVVDLHHRIGVVAAAVAVVSRLATSAMVVLSVVALAHSHGYTNVALATAVYAVVAGWTAVFLVVVLRRDPVPGWVLSGDVLVTAAGLVALPMSARTAAFEDQVANAGLEPITVAVAAAVSLISGSGRRTAVCCAVLAVSYVAAYAPTAHSAADVLSDVSVVGWQVGTAACCYVLISRLRSLADVVDSATREVVSARERVAARRAQGELRLRHFHEQVRRYRALHDGPLRILTAIAGPGPAGHPDPAIRRQCSVSANILRGAAPDGTGGTLTDLSLALIEAGNASAALGLRVTYHFANLPEDLPGDVVAALQAAGAEALTNAAVHAGTGRAHLTATGSGDTGQPAVAVAVVDQGKGFDPDGAVDGYGIPHSIVTRMHEVGGAATVDSHPGQGTRVDLRWPA